MTKQSFPKAGEGTTQSSKTPVVWGLAKNIEKLFYIYDYLIVTFASVISILLATWYLSSQLNNFRLEAIKRDNNFRLEAIKRDNNFRLEAIKRDNNFQQEAIKRDNNFQQEAIKRDNNFQQEAIKRDNNFQQSFKNFELAMNENFRIQAEMFNAHFTEIIIEIRSIGEKLDNINISMNKIEASLSNIDVSLPNIQEDVSDKNNKIDPIVEFPLTEALNLTPY